MRVRIASTKATQKITKAMQMVAASKLRRAQEAAEAARPYAERMDAVIGNIAAAVGGTPGAPRAAGRHRHGSGPSAAGRAPASAACAGAFNSSIVRLARERAQRADRRGQGGQVLLRRPQGLRAAAPRLYEKPIVESVELRSVRQLGFDNAEDDRRQDHRAVRGRRVRRLHAVLLALPVGDRADPDRAAAHPAGGAEAPAANRRARGSTNTSRTRRTSWPSCCRATSRCRSSARCWRTSLASTAPR